MYLKSHWISNTKHSFHRRINNWYVLRPSSIFIFLFIFLSLKWNVSQQVKNCCLMWRNTTGYYPLLPSAGASKVMFWHCLSVCLLGLNFWSNQQRNFIFCMVVNFDISRSSLNIKVIGSRSYSGKFCLNISLN